MALNPDFDLSIDVAAFEGRWPRAAAIAIGATFATNAVRSLAEAANLYGGPFLGWLFALRLHCIRGMAGAAARISGQASGGDAATIGCLL